MPILTKPLLAIETSTSACSVAVKTPNGDIQQRYLVGNNIHSQELLPMVQALLAEANLKLRDFGAIGVSKGPGSFTGLRIGIGVAQGLAYGAGLPMFGYSSLAALSAQNIQTIKTDLVFAAIDARMNEVYWCQLTRSADSGLLTKVFSKQINLTPPRDLAEALENVTAPCTILGNAWTVYPELSKLEITPDTADSAENDCAKYPLAAGILELAYADSNFEDILVSPSDFVPSYVRDNVAAVPKAR